MAGYTDKEALFNWVNSKLSTILDFPVPQDLTQYILSIENVRDLEDYLKTLLNFNNTQHRQFYEELLQKRQIGFAGFPLDIQGYKKSETEEVYITPKQTEKKKKYKGQSEDVSQKVNIKELQAKRKVKFVNLYSPDGQARDVILLKGRHSCNCQASKHRLVNNCLSCGRIVCEQEGSGPCLFCSNLVSSREEQKLLLLSGSKHVDHMHQKKPEGLESAIQHMNRLLEFDKTSDRRTKVIDDESDYFTINSPWLSKTERDKLQRREKEIHARRHSSRLDRRVTLDFAGRQVLEDDESEIFYDAEDSVLKEIGESVKENRRDLTNGSNVHPDIMHAQPVFQEVGSLPSAALRMSGRGEDNTRVHKRVQDRELIEMNDEGCCLSMHQPWASLLVAGIKVHEGRTWYAAHRGCLWIAAASKIPTPQEIREAENLYKIVNGGEMLRFPLQYPTSCLLGCVNVVDCLPQEEYHIKFPAGESDSPFVFICEDPQELPIQFPVQGKHKIYKIDPKIHTAAQKSLQRMAKLKAERAAIH